jgi:AcrR family transcriptional regulator
MQSICARRPGRRRVSPNAAYRHFRNQAALSDAVRSACISQVAAAIEEQMSKTRLGRDPQVFARKSLRAVGMGYLEFAMSEPGDISHGFLSSAAGSFP